MKSTKLLKRALIIATLVFLIGAVVVLAGFASASFSFDKLYAISYQQNSVTLSTTDLQNLQIDLKIYDLEINFSDSADKIIAEYTKAIDKNGNPITDIVVEEYNGTCKLNQTQVYLLGIVSAFEQQKLVVTIPSSYQNIVQANLLNGTIVVNGKADCSQIALSTLNGAINVKNAQLTVDKVSFTIVNGIVNLGSINANDVVVDLTNGQINSYSNIVSNKFSANTVNGKIVSNNGYIDSDDINLHTVNGGIKVAVFGDSQMYTKTISTVNGNTNVVTENKGQRQLNASTVNGDIVITFVSEL